MENKKNKISERLDIRQRRNRTRIIRNIPWYSISKLKKEGARNWSFARDSATRQSLPSSSNSFVKIILFRIAA
jgi:hypothetical protein